MGLTVWLTKRLQFLDVSDVVYFIAKQGGWGGEILSLWVEFYVRKQCKVREFLLCPRSAKSMRWLIIITLLAELGVNDWLVISFMRGGGGVVAPWSSPSRDPRGVLPCKGLMGTCGKPGYVFRDFCVRQGIDFIIFCLNQGIFPWTINSLRVCFMN